MEDRYWANVHLQAIAYKLKMQKASDDACERLWAEYAQIVAREVEDMNRSCSK